MKNTNRNLFKRIEHAHELMVNAILSNLPTGYEENDRSDDREVVAIAPLTATLEERTS